MIIEATFHLLTLHGAAIRSLTAPILRWGWNSVCLCVGRYNDNPWSELLGNLT